MRTSHDFDSYYKSPDPWQIAKASRRDKALAAIVTPYTAGKSVLELGCGEGHLTGLIFSNAKAVKGVDISPIAISRAAAHGLRNASFVTADFLDISFAGYDVIAAIECLYYLAPAEQEAFFRKLEIEHQGLFVLSGPIIGSNEYRTYFKHDSVIETFRRHGLSVVEWRNLNAYRKAGYAATAAAAACRLPFGDRLVPFLPERFVYQRCYIARLGDPNI